MATIISPSHPSLKKVGWNVSRMRRTRQAKKETQRFELLRELIDVLDELLTVAGKNKEIVTLVLDRILRSVFVLSWLGFLCIVTFKHAEPGGNGALVFSPANSQLLIGLFNALCLLVFHRKVGPSK